MTYRIVLLIALAFMLGYSYAQDGLPMAVAMLVFLGGFALLGYRAGKEASARRFG